MDKFLPTPAELAAQVEALPEHVVLHVLAKLDDPLGEDGGHFVSALLTTIDRADIFNRHKLSLVFPEYVTAWIAVKDPGGLDRLRARAKAHAAATLGSALSKAGL